MNQGSKNYLNINLFKTATNLFNATEFGRFRSDYGTIISFEVDNDDIKYLIFSNEIHYVNSSEIFKMSNFISNLSVKNNDKIHDKA